MSPTKRGPSANTKKIMAGPIGYVLAGWNPLRLALEIAWLDQISKGRTFCGFARGYQARWLNPMAQHLHVTAADLHAKDAAPNTDAVNREAFQEIFDILKERTIGYDTQTWNRRYRGFMDKIKTGSIYDVAEVLRDLYRLKTDKQLSFGERRMLDTARTLIVKEIAIARDQTEEQVKTEIEAIFLAN